MKKILSLIILITVFSCGKKDEKTASNILSEEIIAVKTANISAINAVSEVTATGLLSTANEAKYAFKIGGIVEKIYVNESQFFRKGQLLATLKITEIESQLSQANLGYEKAKRDYTRAANLYKDSVATLEQLQNAKTGLDIAEKTIDAINFNKKYTSIYANADGFVTKKIVNEGEVIGGGMPVLAINETGGEAGWVLKLGVTDKEWAAIQVGNKCSVVLDAFPDKNFSGFVFRKSQAAEQNSGTFQVEVKPMLGNLKPALGMFGKATIDIGKSTKLLSIPYEAVIEADGNNAFVFAPISGKKVKKVPIVIESFNNQAVIVRSGLENISEIIVSNSAFLNEKSTINIIK